MTIAHYLGMAHCTLTVARDLGSRALMVSALGTAIADLCLALGLANRAAHQLRGPIMRAINKARTLRRHLVAQGL